MERWWAYRVDSPQAAFDAVAALDPFPNSLVGGLGVALKGFVGNPELIYVFVNANDPSADEASQIEAVMARFGVVTGLTFHDLIESDPQPHFIASGPVGDILAALRAYFPGQVSEKPGN